MPLLQKRSKGTKKRSREPKSYEKTQSDKVVLSAWTELSIHFDRGNFFPGRGVKKRD